jgi:hypothetical protein
MYNPAASQVLDPARLRDVVRGLGIGKLITFGAEGLDASILTTQACGKPTAHDDPEWVRGVVSAPSGTMPPR